MAYDPSGLGDAADFLSEAIAGVRKRKEAPKKPEKGVPWRAKVIDGDYYVPFRQVAELLEANDALPAVRKGIEARVRAQDDRKGMGI